MATSSSPSPSYQKVSHSIGFLNLKKNMATPPALASEFAARYMEAYKAVFEGKQNPKKKKLEEKLAKDLEVQLVLGQQHETAEDGKGERPKFVINPN